MTKKMVNKEVATIGAWEFGGLVTDIISSLCGLTSVYGDEVALIKTEDCDGGVIFSVVVAREETDAEHSRRLEVEARVEAYLKEQAKKQVDLYKERFPDLFK